MTWLKTKFAAQASKRLRDEMTDAEVRLWSRLRNRQLLGVKFVRQQPVGPYIADFASREADMVIELDGGQHGESRAEERDAYRSKVLGEHGYRVIRFWNRDVLANTDGVLQVIAAELEKAPSPGLRFAKADLSPEGRGGGLTRGVRGVSK